MRKLLAMTIVFVTIVLAGAFSLGASADAPKQPQPLATCETFANGQGGGWVCISR